MAFFVRAALVGLAASVSATPIAKRDYPAVGACSGVCSGKLHDPSVVYRAETNTYYRFATNDKINTWTAPSLSGPWTEQGPALPGGSSIDLPGNQDLWAPDIFDMDGTYYMFYSVSAIGSNDSDIGVATSQSLDSGSWTDHGSIGVPPSPAYNRIDPNLFQHDPSSGPLLSFGSFWDGIYQISLQNPPLSVSSPTTTELASNGTTPTAANSNIEGSYQFQWGTYYYLFFSSGICCNTPSSPGGLPSPGAAYKIMVCRSENPTSGFVDQAGTPCTNDGGSLVLASHDNVYAPGGQGVFFDPQQNSPVVYYHYVDSSVSYDYDSFFFGWNKLDFSSGWPVVVA